MVDDHIVVVRDAFQDVPWEILEFRFLSSRSVFIRELCVIVAMD